MTDGEPTRVMLDIETLGTEPGSVVLSIGAVEFDASGPPFDHNYYRSISVESCQGAGLEVDDDTLEWWIGQDEAAREVLTSGDLLVQVLAEFSDWYGGVADADEVWAYSPSFDCVMLEHAYSAVGMDAPWSYRDTRDARTLAELGIWPDDVQFRGKEHNALDDASYQAEQTALALNQVEEVRETSW